MSSVSVIKEAITKAKYAMTGEEEKKENVSMKNLKESMAHLKSAQANYKLAQDEGSMSPDEAKEVAESLASLGQQVAATAMSIADGVPSSEGGEMGAPPMGGEQAPPMGQEQGQAPPMGATPPTEGGEEDDDKKIMSAMRDEIDGMKKEKEQMKLSQRYANIFPEAMKQAKAEEFMQRQAPMNVLMAQVVEAESITSGKIQQAMKLAQSSSDTPYHIAEPSSGVIVGGKI